MKVADSSLTARLGRFSRERLGWELGVCRTFIYCTRIQISWIKASAIVGWCWTCFFVSGQLHSHGEQGGASDLWHYTSSGSAPELLEKQLVFFFFSGMKTSGGSELQQPPSKEPSKAGDEAEESATELQFLFHWPFAVWSMMILVKTCQNTWTWKICKLGMAILQRRFDVSWCVSRWVRNRIKAVDS